MLPRIEALPVQGAQRLHGPIGVRKIVIQLIGELIDQAGPSIRGRLQRANVVRATGRSNRRAGSVDRTGGTSIAGRLLRVVAVPIESGRWPRVVSIGIGRNWSSGGRIADGYCIRCQRCRCDGHRGLAVIAAIVVAIVSIVWRLHVEQVLPLDRFVGQLISERIRDANVYQIRIVHNRIIHIVDYAAAAASMNGCIVYPHAPMCAQF